MTTIPTEADWRLRFRAPRTTLPRWADDAPERLLYDSNATGKWEVYAWDRSGDLHRQVTDRREGTLSGHISPDGESIWWFDDTDGDEFGRWVVEGFAGDSRQVMVEELGRAYDTGLNIGRSLAIVGRSTEDGGSIHVVRDGADPQQIYQHAEESWLGGLSADEQLICFHHSEHGDSRHAALRAVDLAGSVVGELFDGPGLGLSSAGFPIAAGDERILVMHERTGSEASTDLVATFRRNARDRTRPAGRGRSVVVSGRHRHC